MKIEQLDYEKRRDIFDFHKWINQKLTDMKSYPNFEQLYFERNESIKKLIEEAIPIVHLGLYFCKPWRNVALQCLTRNPKFDAILEIEDPESIFAIKVEATVAETDKTHMRRQALSRDGLAYFTGPVKRQGRKIIFEPEMIDVEEDNQEIADLAFRRFIRKVEHGYDEQTAILVFVNFYRPLLSRHRAQLLERVRQYIQEKRPPIYGAYFYYSAGLGIDGLQNGRPEFR